MKIREKLRLYEIEICKEDLDIILKCLTKANLDDCREQARKWELEEEIKTIIG